MDRRALRVQCCLRRSGCTVVVAVLQRMCGCPGVHISSPGAIIAGSIGDGGTGCDGGTHFGRPIRVVLLHGVCEGIVEIVLGAHQL